MRSSAVGSVMFSLCPSTYAGSFKFVAAVEARQRPARKGSSLVPGAAANARGLADSWPKLLQWLAAASG
jgi:hypothetical protein